MAKKSWLVETLNNFVMDNFKPYSWCDMWEETIPDKNQMFYFKMVVRPNIYDRTPRSEFGGSFFYGTGNYWKHIPSSCSLELPDPEFYQSFVISIPMLKGDSIKDGKQLEQDPQRKFKYWNHLAVQSIRSKELLDLEEMQELESPKEIFGNNRETTTNSNGWEKVQSYVSGAPRQEWSFI